MDDEVRKEVARQQKSRRGKQPVTVWLTKDLAMKLRIHAVEKDRSVQDCVVTAIKALLA